MGTRGGGVVDGDIRKFAGTLDHAHLRDLLRQRLRDGVLLRWSGKWLPARVREDGKRTFPDEGSPPGGVLSPLLANVDRHDGLDVWFEHEVQPRLKGRAFRIRDADDFVMGFTWEEDARRVLDVLPKRFGRYGLAIHPDQTRLRAFPPSDRSDRSDSSVGSEPGTFDFLDFTHCGGRSRTGVWVVKRRTASSRHQRAIGQIAHWCRFNRHHPLPEQHHTRGHQLRGH
jgi:RNA-directed DNA polymerase